MNKENILIEFDTQMAIVMAYIKAMVRIPRSNLNKLRKIADEIEGFDSMEFNNFLDSIPAG